MAVRAPLVRRDFMMTTSGLVLLGALAASAFGQGAYFSTMQWLLAAMIAVAFAVAVGARPCSPVELRDGVALAGTLLAVWALVRATAAGTPASGLSWALFAAGTAMVVSVCRRLDNVTREIVLDGALAVGAAVAASGWAGVALHARPWGLPSQGLWRAASTLTYPNAAAALLVPLALVTLSRLAAAPANLCLRLLSAGLLAGAAATLSRGAAAAFAAGFVVVCLLQGTSAVVRAAIGPCAGAGIVLLGLAPSWQAAGPARPLAAGITLAAGLAAAALIALAPGRARGLVTVAAAASAALLIAFCLAHGAHGAVRTLAQYRLNLASPDRSAETAAALKLIGQHLVAGAGPGHAILRWVGAGGRPRTDRYVHDEYLQVMADLGVIGTVLVAMLMIAVARLLWRARADASRQATWAGAVAGAVAFAVHSGLDFLWQVPAVPLTVAVLVGLAAPSIKPRKPAVLAAFWRTEQ